MKAIRVVTSLAAFLCLAGWLWLRQPYSPVQDLPPVTITAFNVRCDSPEGGLALAEAARGWAGVTASTYNSGSGLLVLTHSTTLDKKELQRRLQILIPKRVSIKTFSGTAGPRCPVPLAALSALPDWLLGGCITAFLCFILSSGCIFRKKQPGFTLV